LIVPGGILLGLGAILAHSAWIVLTPPTLSFLFYSAFVGGALLCWRFHTSRILFALIITLFTWAIFFAMNAHAVAAASKENVHIALGVLVPIDFLLVSFSEERGFTRSSAGPLSLVLFVECVIIAVLSGSTATPPGHAHHVALPSFPGYVQAGYAITAAILLIRSGTTKKPADSALFWAAIALLLSLNFISSAHISRTYVLVATITLAASVVETSYLLAYHDELTGLPSRRALNDALRSLQDPYSIAVVDVDHFKKFNDSYGHDVGDEVLRLVAAKLAGVTGGGQAYRCGGEEFALIFRGKNAGDVMGNLDLLRKTVEAAQFRVRGNDRRHVPRGPERRKKQKHPRKSKSTLGNAEPVPKTNYSITVSIGAANWSARNANAEMVMQAADKALYKAKENGRNRVEIFSEARGRERQKAGVA
jgi:diguanylate cyclase (GGDEF)-like protein